jgi:hypothetical protein
MSGNYQCFAAACCLHWRGRILQCVTFVQWNWPARDSRAPEDIVLVQEGRLNLQLKILKPFRTPGNMTCNTVTSRNENTLCLASGTWCHNDDIWQNTTITTRKWYTTNLLTYTYIQDVATTGGTLSQAQAMHLVYRMLSGSLVQPLRKVQQHLQRWLTGVLQTWALLWLCCLQTNCPHRD